MYQFLSIFPKVYSGLITSFVSKIAGSAGEAMRTSLAALLGLVLWSCSRTRFCCRASTECGEYWTLSRTRAVSNGRWAAEIFRGFPCEMGGRCDTSGTVRHAGRTVLGRSLSPRPAGRIPCGSLRSRTSEFGSRKLEGIFRLVRNMSAATSVTSTTTTYRA